MTPFIPQMEPVLTEADTAAVDRYMKSGGWLTEFEHTRRFERQIAELTGARFCVAAPSGTMALFLALAACGVRRDDDVIVPDLTMAATATAVLLTGARVTFADIEASTLCLDLPAAEQLISDRTRAVVFVSLNGRAPAGLPAFIARCRRRGVMVIEDAAQSLGSTTPDGHLGTLGDCGCFSFSSQKLVTTGQGGAVVTSDERLHAEMRLLRDFGRAEGGADRYLRVGWNLKFTDLQAVIGIEQMQRLPQLIDRKRRLYAWYAEELRAVPEVQLIPTDLNQTAPWFIDVIVPAKDRERLASHLRNDGIGTRSIYPALHAEPAFQELSPTQGQPPRAAFPVAEEIATRGLWLPSSLRLERVDVARVGAAIRRFFGVS